METIGNRFKRIRQEFDMSQEEFGQHLGLSKASISAVETDRAFVSVKVLSKLFFDYDVNLNYLVCGEGFVFNAAQKTPTDDELTKRVRKILHEEGVI